MLFVLAQIVGDSSADHWLIALAWVGIIIIAAVILGLSSMRRPLSH